MYSKILLAVDNSEDALRAAEKALELKMTENSEVVAFHSVLHHLSEIEPTFTFTGSGGTPLSLMIHQDYIDLGKEALKKVETLFEDEGFEIETRLIYNVPPEDYAKQKVQEENFDLIILGCKGKHSKIKRAILGTVPEKVLNEAPCDVLIVR